MIVACGSVGISGDLSLVVDTLAIAIFTAERADIGHDPVLIEEGDRRAVRRNGAVADDGAIVIDAPACAEPATERADIRHLPVTIEEGAGLTVRRQAVPGELTLFIDAVGGAGLPAERPEVF